jgi:hypothetical protein
MRNVKEPVPVIECSDGNWFFLVIIPQIPEGYGLMKKGSGSKEN